MPARYPTRPSTPALGPYHPWLYSTFTLAFLVWYLPQSSHAIVLLFTLRSGSSTTMGLRPFTHRRGRDLVIRLRDPASDWHTRYFFTFLSYITYCFHQTYSTTHLPNTTPLFIANPSLPHTPPNLRHPCFITLFNNYV